MARGDIYWVELPDAGGREQTGRRPSIAVQTDRTAGLLPTVMVVPFTTNLRALRFPYTLQIEPSPMNGLAQPSVLLVFQMRAVDLRRLRGEPMGRLDAGDLARLDEALRDLLGL